MFIIGCLTPSPSAAYTYNSVREPNSMENRVEAKEARLYKIQDNSITFLQTNSLAILSEDNRRFLIMGDICHELTPETVVWFDSPADDQQRCLTYYFRHTDTEDYMIKIHNNIHAVQQAVQAGGCELRERKVYFRHPNYNVTNSNGFYQSMGSLGSILNYGASTLGVGIAKTAEYCSQGIQRVGGMIANNINPGQPLSLPNARGVAQQARSMSDGALNMARQLIGNFFTGSSLNNYVIPSDQDHPIVRTGKNVLGGALNLYTGAMDGVGHLQNGIVGGVGQIAERRYGNDVHQVIQNTMGAVDNLQGIVREPARQIGNRLRPQ